MMIESSHYYFSCIDILCLCIHNPIKCDFFGFLPDGCFTLFSEVAQLQPALWLEETLCAGTHGHSLVNLHMYGWRSQNDLDLNSQGHH